MNFQTALKELPISPDHIFNYIDQSYIVHTLNVREVECLVVCCAKSKYQFVIPRGTEFDKFFSGNGWRDVLRDLRALPWRNSRLGGWSHSGFLKGALGLVDKGLFGVLRREVPAIFIGHSLGGALALNCAAILHGEGFTVAGVITVGSPRTFMKRTATKVSKLGFPIWQFSNEGDPVPDVPFRFWRYRHCREIKTNRPGKGYSIKRNHSLSAYKKAFGL